MQTTFTVFVFLVQRLEGKFIFKNIFLNQQQLHLKFYNPLQLPVESFHRLN